MTNEEKLKEIERLWTLSKMTYDVLNAVGNEDVVWLINRVKVLTEALAYTTNTLESLQIYDSEIKAGLYKGKEALNDTGDRTDEKEKK